MKKSWTCLSIQLTFKGVKDFLITHEYQAVDEDDLYTSLEKVAVQEETWPGNFLYF